jgi:hypothetical protein
MGDLRVDPPPQVTIALGVSETVRLQLAQRFDTANLHLGNVSGEFAGELLLNGFFLVCAVALALCAVARRCSRARAARRIRHVDAGRFDD